MNSHPSYELFEELGRGAHSVVYRAFDLSLNREVAIKELDQAARRDPRHRERFLREAQFLAQFEHDNVLRVYSVDTERGWIIMELMQGTLASVIETGPSEPDLVRSVLQQTLDALAFLHDKNKVHGTVRPTNLLINDAGRVKLSEFEQTAVGGELRAPSGSKKYLAPELIRPEFGDFGPPTDLYCLGVTALELLKGPQFDGLFPGTGKGAIDADTAWLRWHSSPEELSSIAKLVKGIPDDLAHVLDRMLKKRVADRAQSAQEVLRELADRPLVPIPVASVTDDDAAATVSAAVSSPAVVRTLAPGQQVTLPQHAEAATTAARSGPAKPSPAKQKNVPKSAPAKASIAYPRFSRDWWNYQLGRPYVLYPLCALILLGALWYGLGISIGGAAASIPVTFDIAPDASGVDVVENDQPLTRSPDGSYALAAGPHSVTFRKAGFHPVTQQIDVSPERNKFDVKLEPIITYSDVTFQIAPADATLRIGEKSTSLVAGTHTHKHQQGQPLEISVARDGFVAVSRSFTPDELKQLENKIALELEREKPKLPALLMAAPGAALDSEVQLPNRVRSTRFGNEEPLEFVLVKPGQYSFGVSGRSPREGELPEQSVTIAEPFYMSVHEITNAQYNEFFEMEGEGRAGTRWQIASKKWADPLGLESPPNDLPATNISAAQAEAFCRWVGGRLPSEEEWESAVRGPNDRGYPLPWGTAEPTPERCQIFYGELGPVAVDELTAGASPLGIMHAVGNAAEWCHDSQKPGGFILRGASFATANIDDVRVTWRRQGDTRGEEDTGFRVVVPADSNLEPPRTQSAAKQGND